MVSKESLAPVWQLEDDSWKFDNGQHERGITGDSLWSLRWNFAHGNLVDDGNSNKFIIKMLLEENANSFKLKHFAGKG